MTKSKKEISSIAVTLTPRQQVILAQQVDDLIRAYNNYHTYGMDVRNAIRECFELRELVCPLDITMEDLK